MDGVRTLCGAVRKGGVLVFTKPKKEIIGWNLCNEINGWWKSAAVHHLQFVRSFFR